MYLVYIDGLEFYGFHGVSEEERKVGHRFVVSLEFEVEGKADRTDKVADTLDYGAAALATETFAKKASHHTVERLARLLGEHLIETFPMADAVRVRLGKRLPPAPIIADEVGVEIEVRRRAAR